MSENILAKVRNPLFALAYLSVKKDLNQEEIKKLDDLHTDLFNLTTELEGALEYLTKLYEARAARKWVNLNPEAIQYPLSAVEEALDALQEYEDELKRAHDSRKRRAGL